MVSETQCNNETILEWTKGPSTFRAWPSRGARLMSWHRDGRDVIYWPENTVADQVAKARGGNPVLFPFAARTFHDGEIGKWRTPNGEIRDMPNHGITRQGEFVLVDRSDSGYRARLVPDDMAGEIYPFSYCFEVEYRFFEDAIEVDFILENHDKVAIPWSAGHHFYFSLPSIAGAQRADYWVDIPADKACYQDAKGAIVPTDPDVGLSKFDDPALIDRIHYGLRDRKVVFGNDSDTAERIEIEFTSPGEIHPDWAVVTWTESDRSPFYCVEPWMGPPNSNETKVGLHWVAPDETCEFSIRVKV